MHSEQSRQAIDALSKEDLIQEIHRGNRSRFQGDNYAYLQTRLTVLKQQEQAEQKKEEIGVGKEANELAKEANDIAREANITASKAYRTSIFSVLVALVAALIALLPQCSGKP